MIDCNKVHFQLGGGRVRVWGDPGAVSPNAQVKLVFSPLWAPEPIYVTARKDGSFDFSSEVGLIIPRHCKVYEDELPEECRVGAPYSAEEDGDRE